MITFNSNELKFNNDGVMTPLPYFSNATASSLDARLTSAESNITALQSGKMDEWTLLWTNASPTSTFASQTLSIDFSGYTKCAIQFAEDSPIIIVQLNVGFTQVCFKWTDSIGDCIIFRSMYSSNDSLYFSNCDAKGVGSSTSRQTVNSSMIPYKIYGIK